MLSYAGSDFTDGRMTEEITSQSFSLEQGYHGNRWEQHDLFCFDSILIWMAGYKSVLPSDINHDNLGHPLEIYRGKGTCLRSPSWAGADQEIKFRHSWLQIFPASCLCKSALTGIALSLLSVALKSAIDKLATSESHGKLLKIQILLTYLQDFDSVWLGQGLGMQSFCYFSFKLLVDDKDQQVSGNTA